MDNAPKLTIRGPNGDDWASLYDLLIIPAVLNNTLELPYVGEEAFRERFGHVQADQHLLVAETALPSGRKRVIGGAWLNMKKAPRRRHVGELTTVVHPDYWRTEAARNLLNAVCSLTDDWLGLRRLQTIVFAADLQACEFYEQAGFEREATLRHYALRSGVLSDAVLLARLAPAATTEGAQQS